MANDKAFKVKNDLDVGGDVTVAGNLTVEGSTISLDNATVQTFTWGDNDKAVFGDGSDLQIYHDGTTSKIDGNVSFTNNVTLSGGTANGVPYLNGSKVLTSGSALTFNGSNTFTVVPATGTAYNRTESAQYSTWLQTGAGNANVFWEFSAGTPVRWVDTSAGELMRLTSTGLGIGTSTFDEVLRINGSSNAASRLRIQNQLTTIGFLGSHLGIVGSGNANDLILSTGGATNLTFGINTSEKMRLTSTGLGIGTSSPGYKLHVSATASTAGYFTSSGAVTTVDLDNTNANGWGGNIAIKTGGTAAGYFGTIGSLLGNTTQDLAVYATDGNGFRVYTNGNNERLRIDSSGNLGLGVTPSAWGAIYRALQIGSNGRAALWELNGGTALSYNQYHNGTNNIYVASTGAMRYRQNGIAHIWDTAPSGTAGSAISFTQAMTLHASGGLSLGNTSDPGAGTLNVNGITVGRGAGAVSTNTAVGAAALATANSGVGRNTAIGYATMTSNSTGINNTGVGQQALTLNTTGTDNSSVGYASLFLNTTGSANTAMGVGSIQNNTTGGNNTAFGYAALNANTTASNNTAVGYQAGYSNTTGTQNVFVGTQAGYSNTVSNESTFVGWYAGFSATGASNTFLGRYAGADVSTGNSNTLIGSNSGYLITTGSKNTILGRYNGNQGGLDIRTSDGYIVLSDGDGNPRGIFDSSGNLLVGTTATVNSSKMFMHFSGGRGFGINDAAGNAGTQVVWFQSAGTQVGSISITTSATSYNTSSDYRLKEDWVAVADASTRVNALKPVNFAWKADGKRVDGFLAHELADVVPEAVTGEKDAVDDEGNPVYQGIDQSKLVPLLTAALQEALAEIKSLKDRLDAANI